MGVVIVRYKPQADRADENQRLVEAVYAELHQKQPENLRYSTFRLDDGSFVHVGDFDGDNPLNEIDAFKTFTDGIAERCEPGQAPNPQPAKLVGSYRYF